jgi:hypothetical protein
MDITFAPIFRDAHTRALRQQTHDLRRRPAVTPRVNR